MDNGDTQNIEPTKPVDNRRPDGTFGPGNVANPNGRPKKGMTLTDLMRDFLETTPTGQQLSYKDAFIRKVYKLAMEDGSESAIRLIWNYIDGMPVQKNELGGVDGKDLFPQPILDAVRSNHSNPQVAETDKED